MAGESGPLLVGIDVGSRSVRAGVFGVDGGFLGRGERAIVVATPAAHHFEQSTDEIWMAVRVALAEALRQGAIDPARVAAIGFDATSSSVALFHADGSPASISASGDDHWNVVMWCDHRAREEARDIDATHHPVLRHVGGTMSPEMALPKLLWLKRNMGAAWAGYGLALELTDFLAWRATGRVHASICTLTCKWAFLAHETEGWQQGFLAGVGLPDALPHLRLPRTGLPIGTPVGRLSAAAAADLGLTTRCIVAAGLIDAHAGCMGPLGGLPADGLDYDLALIGGTSSCLMTLSREPRFIPGVWGPYFGTLREGLWLNESGLSATGAALDHVIALHAAGTGLGPKAQATLIAEVERRLAAGETGPLSRYLVVPDFNGNRSPLADAGARGIIAGLDLDTSAASLADLYHATCVGIALGTRHVIDALNAGGYAIRRLHLTGGHARNPLLVRLYADATGCEVLASASDDGVLIGNAINAAVAAGLHADLEIASRRMWTNPAAVTPDFERGRMLAARFQQYRMLQEAARGGLL